MFDHILIKTGSSWVEFSRPIARGTMMIITICACIWSLYSFRKYDMTKLHPRRMFAVAAALTIVTILATAQRGSTRFSHCWKVQGGSSCYGAQGSQSTLVCLLLLMYSLILRMMVLTEEKLKKYAKVVAKICYALMFLTSASMLFMYSFVNATSRFHGIPQWPHMFSIALLFFIECRLYGAARGCLRVGLAVQLTLTATLVVCIYSWMGAIEHWRQYTPSMHDDQYLLISTVAFLINSYISLTSGWKCGYKTVTVTAGYVLLLASEIASFILFILHRAEPEAGKDYHCFNYCRCLLYDMH
ncbi:hypothetical protein PMAYCL1PPCAC_10812 [Pristionchus mayeri]|uniref:Uncharacterized protein n=1 Tax=Pristionchus mayeri TaxID=1317129 RepID=A0AAN5CFW6_9BILA|nr:hypothetical protein PMAYCL1PPCAC_10806 [Pristionchus mayeri]GMR40617.1 hypothetical protein PMAYCL1PPCAC_10812 [Pristionchus mayeri]